MGYRDVVKGSLIVLEEGIKLPEGTQVEVTPVKGLEKVIPLIELARYLHISGLPIVFLLKGS